MEGVRLNSIGSSIISVINQDWQSGGRVVQVGQDEAIVILIFGIEYRESDSYFLTIGDGLLEFHLDDIARNSAPVD